MKRTTCIIGMLLTMTIVSSTFAGCGKKATEGDPVAKDTMAKDTITALLPPVSPTYQKNFEQMQKILISSIQILH